MDYVADPRTRRNDFIDWIEKLQEVTYTESATEDILADFPSLSDDTPDDVNKIFAQLILAYITRRVKDFMSKSDKINGTKIIRLLQRIFAPASILDRDNAMNELTSLLMLPNELVSAFFPRFHRKVTAVNMMSLPGYPPLSEFQQILLFVQKLD